MNHRIELLKQAQANEFPHFGMGAGDGVVYVGGGKYWPMIVAGIRLLRHVGCTLPVEIWYRGKCEEVFPEDVEGLNVRLCDVDTMGQVFGDSRIPTGFVCKGGWEAKLYAIYHTNFDRILFLDADAYCVQNPEPMFDELRGSSFIYWRDLHAQDNIVKWEEVYPSAIPENVPPVQGGQLLIDRNKAQRLIHVCNWMCQNSDYFFKRMYGDQDTWRVGLAMGLSDAWCIDFAKWNRIAFECRYKEQTMILHRCRGKLFEPKYIPAGDRNSSNPVFELPMEEELFTFFAEAVSAREPEASEVFAEIYRRKLWGTKSPSGDGSTLEQGQPFIDEANRLIAKYGIRSIVDAGCGTGLIGSKLNVDEYIGVDCYADIISENQKKFPEKTFLTVDILTEYDIIPVADCLVCRDVLHHWPTKLIVQFLDKLIESKKFKYLIICQDSKQFSDSQDCHLGGWRGLNFRMYPLNRYTFKEVCDIHYKTVALMGL